MIKQKCKIWKSEAQGKDKAGSSLCFKKTSKSKVETRYTDKVNLLQKAVCPNTPKCGVEKYDLYWFNSNYKVWKEYDINKDLTNSFCSYWIRPPPNMSALDHIDISFRNF